MRWAGSGFISVPDAESCAGLVLDVSQVQVLIIVSWLVLDVSQVQVLIIVSWLVLDVFQVQVLNPSLGQCRLYLGTRC